MKKKNKNFPRVISATCCCCCYVTSVVSNSVRPHRWQPTRLCHPWDSPGKNTGVGCHSFSNAWKWKVKVKSLSCVWLFTTPWTAAHQAPPSMGFSRQEYWSGVPLASPRVISNIFLIKKIDIPFKKKSSCKYQRNLIIILWWLRW